MIFAQTYSHGFQSKGTQKGFSLLELALALTVLAILTGGVLKGRELIQSAKVQGVVSRIGELETALTAFEGRFGALPGDVPDAAAMGLRTGSGNGNGLIDSPAEEALAFGHLQDAGLLKGSFDGVATEASECPKSTCAEAPWGGPLLISHAYGASSGSINRLALVLQRPVSPQWLAELDRKLDDGRANSGSIQLVKGQPADCTLTGSGLWNEKASVTCMGLYLMR